MAYTPMLQQYLATKEAYKDCMLFFRVGDFYEMYFEDAVEGSKAMELALTKKGCGDGQFAPMCGVPYHAVENYIERLINKGYKVAICEQMADPSTCKGIVPREVIRVVTPGTILSQNMLSDGDNNFLLCIYYSGKGFGLSWADISTGEFFAMKIEGKAGLMQLSSQLIKIQPKEIITNAVFEDYPELYEQFKLLDRVFVSPVVPDYFEDKNCSSVICRHFNAANPKSIGLDKDDEPLLFYGIGAVLGYLKETQKQDPGHLSKLQLCSLSDTMSLDRATVKNLEITETLFERKLQGSLLGVLDRTGTAMGSRKMKAWLRQPLNSREQIDGRLNAVECLVNDVILRNNLREELKPIYDLERLSARIACKTANSRDLIALKTSIAGLPGIKDDLSSSADPFLSELASHISGFQELFSKIDAAITDEPPFSVREGGMIKPGYSQELDALVASVADSTKWIAELEGSERVRTGINKLKVGFNKVFGYYIEVSKSYADKVPDNYIRKQTLVGGERYITPELKEAESLVLNAQTKINDLQYRLFSELREAVEQQIPALQESSSALAAVDVLCSFAESSVKLNYVKPFVYDGDEIVIRRGRHPVIENTISDGVYVSNDVYLNKTDSSMLLITGPNMAGKSTYMRQLALIVLMAQAGCFVPADEAKIGICDRIYTRIGASDNIAMGQSTFYVEMSELAYILNTATEKSLVILDEIGRGTSTYDGLSIAWAALEELTSEKRRVRTLFATHYHELTLLAGTVPGVKNLNVDVSEENGNIVFLHKIIEGAASRSYGIHVAKLAGVPKRVLNSAERKLSQLVNEASVVDMSIHGKKENEQQLSLFSPKDSVLAAKVKNLDLMNMTPSQAFSVLEELQKYAKDE